jgi:hypothetical protein
LTWLLSSGAIASADTFRLRDGGRLSGELLNAEQDPRTTYVVRLESGGEVILNAADVARVEAASPEEVKYRELLNKIPEATAENHWIMAEWCRRQRMSAEQDFHLQHVIALQPNHVAARRALGYQPQANDGWARTEDIWKADGYVTDGGDWRVPQQQRVQEAQKARDEARLEWQRNLKMWRGWLGGRRSQQAVERITSIDDPLAAEPLAHLFLNEVNPRLREVLAEILGRLDSPLATQVLARAALDENDYEMRMHCLKQLKGNHRGGAVSIFVGALGSKDNARVNRAGTALGRMQDKSAVLPLIQALHTTHKFRIGGSANNMNASFDRTGRGGGLSMGNRAKVIEKQLSNQGVRDALISLTDQNFEFRELSWKAWYLAQSTPPNLDLRRDR